MLEKLRQFLSPKRNYQVIDLTGQRFNRLVVIKAVGIEKNYGMMWLCQCDCGNQKVVPGSMLRYHNGERIKSCGCLKRENAVRYLQSEKARTISRENGKKNKGKPSKRRMDPLPPKLCLQCGREFEISRGTDKEYRERRRFCSSECWYEFLREDASRNPAWRGGYSPYYGPNWDKQRRAARKRDRYFCQQCNKTEKELGRELEVHHIVPFRIFGIERYREANHLDNLISLCKSCHSKQPDP